MTCDLRRNYLSAIITLDPREAFEGTTIRSVSLSFCMSVQMHNP